VGDSPALSRAPGRSRFVRLFLEWNPLEWGVVDRCRLVACIMLPFSLGYWILDEIVVLRPSLAPYYDFTRLGPFQHVLEAFILAWVALLALAPWFRRRAPRGEKALVWITIQLYSVGNAVAAVWAGLVTTPHVMVLIGGVAVAFFLFDLRAVVSGMISASVIIAASIVGTLAGWIPYAPMLARAPYVDGRISPWWLAFMGVISLAVGLALITLFVYLTTRLRDRELQLHEVARTDPLTGVSNRRRFLELFALEFERVQRYGGELSCVMLDLDHFKGINDRYGHAVGDRVLVAAADAFRSSLRTADVIARWGGEEFALLLPQTNLTGAQAVAERCRRALEEATITAEGARIRVTVSVGVAGLRGGGVDSPDALMRSADAALYEAKHSGRNRVVSVPPPPVALPRSVP
jgi:diguanylate cyclase (GGDEF)-like protein